MHKCIYGFTYTSLLLTYRYVKKGYLYTKGYLFLICNSLMFFFSLPIIEIVIAVIKGTNNNTIKHFPFLALYPEYYYNFPMYEVRSLFSGARQNCDCNIRTYSHL